MARICVRVRGDDAISREGVATQLRRRSEVLVLDEGDAVADVTLMIVDAPDAACAQAVRGMQRNGEGRVVLIVSDLDDGDLLLAVEMGASGVLRRSEATPERLSSAVLAAASGEGTLAPDLLGRLIGQVSRLQQGVLAPRGIGPTGLSERELAVMRMLAEGYDTCEVAQRLAYSERTIKNVVHGVVTRFNLRNRAHAVAYVVKAGLI